MMVVSQTPKVVLLTSNTVMILTSNVEAHKILEAGGDSKKAEKAVRAALQQKIPT